MITIQSGKLTIPEDERLVGFAGDNLSNSKTFILPGCGNDAGSYTLCLRFDDDSTRSVPLTKSVSGSDLILTWNIQAAHLLKAGIVMAQIKTVGSDDVILHTGCDYFIVLSSAEFADDGGVEYVSRAEIEERLAAIRSDIRDSAPYIGQDGYWYVYDVESDSFVRSESATAHITVDNAMISGSANPVESRAIKAFVESALNGKVSVTTRIAGLQLNANISAEDLAMSLRGNINPPMVINGSTMGYGGQFGKTTAGKPMMCALGSTWIELAKADDVYSKAEIDSMIGDIETQLAAI